LSYADINNQASDDEYCPKSDAASSGLLRQLNRIYANSSYYAQHPDGDDKLRNHPNADEHYFFTDTMLGLGNYYVEAGVEQ
jgi:hypothetical protein